MVILAFLFYIILTLVLISLVLRTLKIQVEITEFKYRRKSTKDIITRKKQTRKKSIFLIKIRFYILKKIPIIVFEIDENKLKQIEQKRIVQKAEKRAKKVMNKMQKEIIKNYTQTKNTKVMIDIITIAKELKLKFKKFNLKIGIGVEDMATTIILVPIISTIVAILLRNVNLKENKYEVRPIYNLKNSVNEINIFLNCTIEMHIVYLINVINKMKKRKNIENLYRYSYE